MTLMGDLFHPIHCSAALGAFAFAFYVIPYFLDPYDYRLRFPGPRLAGFTNWWLSNLVRTGNHSKVIQELHEQYGTFVRIGPNHISIADPDAHEVVYGHGSRLLKSDFYKMFANDSRNVFDTPDRAEHARKRKRLSHIFSPQNVLAFEPRVRGHIQQLCAQWDVRCRKAVLGIPGINWHAKCGGAAIDICAQFSYLAFDIMGDLALGSPFGLIQAQQDSSPIIESVDASGEPQIGSMGIPVARTIASFFHGILLKRGSRKDIEAGKRSIDLIDKLVEVKNEDGSPLSLDELYTEALLLLIAGSDTTSNTLSSLFYHLAIHPHIQRGLQAELDQHISYDASDEGEGKEEDVVVPPPKAVVEYDQVKNLPYLNACVKEALRIHSTTFKPGSVISVPSYTTNRSKVWGNDAEEFRPERWLGDNSRSLNKYFVPFSVGPRACVGRNLAYMDLMMITATLVRRYQIEALPTTKLIIHEAFVREAAHCELMIKQRMK
ncbi:hypothetical protein OPQ81_005203 [Rhizoctonia solani]|nr:hypothetical protein OPQ81_005203 [Rhizoctonia solani]